MDGASTTPTFDFTDEGLVVWPGTGFETEVIYDLRSRKLRRTVRGAQLEGETPPLAGRHAVFARQPVYWSVWSTAWHRLEHGDVPLAVLTGPSLLPTVH
jgi:galactose mutarotase-like enzyme